jgi:hypothetical protein
VAGAIQTKIGTAITGDTKKVLDAIQKTAEEAGTK